MPRESITRELPASCEAAFDLIHDYDRRLLWDSMLSRAEILDGSATAGKGVRTLCVATWRGAWLGMVTEYISFERGRVAAVKLVRPMPRFGRFAATIAHEPISADRSSVTYIYSFRSRPGLLRFILDPLLNMLLRREVRKRLSCLQSFLTAESAGVKFTHDLEHSIDERDY